MNLKILIFACFTALLVVLGDDPIIRDLRYLILPASMLFYFTERGTKKQKESLLFHLIIFFSILALSSIFYSIINDNFLVNQAINSLKETLFILFPLVSVLFLKKSPSFELDRFITSSFVFFFTFQLVTILIHPPQINFNLISFILMGSESDFEGSHTFIFGFVSLYFFLNKKFRLFTLSLILLFFYGKRIVLFGIVFLVIINPILKRLSYKKLMATLISSYALILAVLVLFSLGYFNDFFLDQFGISINAFTKGRYYLLSSAFTEFNTSSILLGNGSGFTTTYLKSINASTSLLHSDILKILIEFGLVGTVFFIYLFFYRLHNKNSVIFAFLMLLLAISDNVIIYNHVMFYYFLIVSSMMDLNPIQRNYNANVVDEK